MRKLLGGVSIALAVFFYGWILAALLSLVWEVGSDPLLWREDFFSWQNLALVVINLAIGLAVGTTFLCIGLSLFASPSREDRPR